jgi:hypothetical protein
VGKTKKRHEMKVPTAMLSKFTENAEKTKFGFDKRVSLNS